MAQPPVVACISLERWDSTWRRNQHFASRLVSQGQVRRLVFVEPPMPGLGARSWSPAPGIAALRPPLLLPKRLQGLRATGAWLRRTALRDVDIIWVNDPALGVHCLPNGRRAVYDVTDDLRTFAQPAYITDRIVAAENALADRARTIVCSDVLAQRWRQRYGVDPAVVRNAVDVADFAAAEPVTLPGPSPHIGYVGTLHGHRLDVDLVLDLADTLAGTVHLVGPDSLEPADRQRLSAHPRVQLTGAVPASAVPGWMKAMDVLVCPHLVNEFTLSLDAIKSHEYLAAGRPVVATATSGFQAMTASALAVVDRSHFVSEVLAAVGRPALPAAVIGWDERTHEFAAALLGAP